MKTQNTLENKAAFFAQYWGKHVAVCIDYRGGSEEEETEVNSYNIHRIKNLKLTPLSQISDEDALWVANRVFISDYVLSKKDDFLIDKGRKYISQERNCNFLDNQYHIDYLRSKSYAVAWRDLSVDDLVEYGWVKLKTE